MPQSSGEGFPNTGAYIGYEHLHLGDGYIYRYVGGSNGYPLNWVRARGQNLYAHVNSFVNQIPVDTNPTLVTYDNVSFLNGILFNNIGTFTIQTTGLYFLSTNGQVMKTGGAGQLRLTQWFRKNGSDIAGSPVTNSVSANPNDMRVVRNLRIEQCNVGDTIQVFQQVETAGLGLGLYTAAVGLQSPSAKLTIMWIPF